MTKIAKLINSQGHEENTILIDDDYIVPDGYTITIVPPSISAVKQTKFTHTQVLKQLPAGAVKQIMIKAKTDDDVAAWKYMFEQAQELDSTDPDFQSGIAALKSLNILPADWELV